MFAALSEYFFGPTPTAPERPLRGLNATEEFLTNQLFPALRIADGRAAPPRFLALIGFEGMGRRTLLAKLAATHGVALRPLRVGLPAADPHEDFDACSGDLFFVELNMASVRSSETCVFGLERVLRSRARGVIVLSNQIQVATVLGVEPRNTFYVRVPAYADRLDVVRDTLADLLAAPLEGDGGTARPTCTNSEVVAQLVANASAGCTPLRIVVFLREIFNEILADIAHDYAAQDLVRDRYNFEERVRDTLSQTSTQLALDNDSKVPFHAVYGPRPYAVDLRVARQVRLLDADFGLANVDIEDETWLAPTRPALARRVLKRKRALPALADAPRPPNSVVLGGINYGDESDAKRQRAGST